MMNGRPWTKPEIKILHDAAYKGLTCAEMAILLPNCTRRRIYSRLRTDGIRSGQMPRGSRHRKKTRRHGPVTDPSPGEIRRRKAAVRAERC